MWKFNRKLFDSISTHVTQLYLNIKSKRSMQWLDSIWFNYVTLISRIFTFYIIHTYNVHSYFHYCFIIQLSELRFTSMHIAVQCNFNRCASIQIQLMRLFCLCSIYTAQVQMYHFGKIHSHNVEFCWFQGEKTVWFCFFSLESFFLTGNGVSKWKMGDFPQKNELAECSIRII